MEHGRHIRRHRQKRTFFTSYIVLAVLLAACLIVGMIFDQVSPGNVSITMLVGMLLLVAMAGILFVTKRLTYERILLLLIAAGFVLRMGYILYTPYNVRQHDVGSFGGSGGHSAYIQYIAEHLSLPNTNGPWQFYQPPLHHILSGLWLRLNLVLNVPQPVAYENLQILPCFYSCVVMIVCHDIMKELKLSKGATVLAMSILCFHPTFIILAGNINNDMLMILLFLASLLYILRWYRQPLFANIVLAGLFLGLAMMAKISAVLLAPVIAFIFIAKLWTQRSRLPGLILQGGASCVLAIILGTWYPIRNYFLYQQPLTYVPHIGATFQDISSYTVADRLWNIPWGQLYSPYQNWVNGYSIPLSMMKTATFGEAAFNVGLVADILLYANVLLAVLAFGAMIWMLVSRKEREKAVRYWALAIAWLVLVASYIGFCFSYPDICTQDIRYIVPTLLTGSVFLGLAMDKLLGIKGDKILVGVLVASVVVFCLCTAVTYIAFGAMQ